MSAPRATPGRDPARRPAGGRSALPNRLTRFRLVTSPLLPLLALLGRPGVVVAAVVGLQVTDWIDGPLARRWGAQSEYGARLDSLADLTMFAGLMGALAILRGTVLLAAWPWWTVAAMSWAASCLFSRGRFGVWPAYHLWTAKVSGPVTLVAAILLLLSGETWPVRVAATLVTLANVEAILMTARLETPRTDVRSVLAAPGRASSGAGP